MLNKKQLTSIEAIQSRNIRISVLLILVVTFIAFLPSLQNGFTNWDDDALLTQNEKIRKLDFAAITGFFKEPHEGLYHPLVLLTYAVEYRFFGLNPFIYHATNLALHLLNCLLVFAFFYLFTRKINVAFIVAILFGIHPLRVESVAWIAERKDVLYAFFFISSLICYVYYSKSGKIIHYMLSLCLFTLSVFAKPMAITLPFVLLLYDYFTRKKITSETIVQKIPFVIIALIFAALTFYLQKSEGGIRQSQSLFFNMIIASYGILFYIVKALMPVNLSILYTYPASTISKLPFIYYLSPLVLVILLATVFYLGRRNRNIVFGCLFFLVTMSPVLQVIPVGKAVAADRFTYIPLLGLFYIFAESFTWLHFMKINYPNFTKPLLFSLLIIVNLASVTFHRCEVWKDSITLWDSVIEKQNNISLAYNNRGNAYSDLGRYDTAIEDYTKAIYLDPLYADAYFNRGNAYNQANRLAGALADYGTAIEIKPGYAKAYLHRAVVYTKQGEFEKAAADFKTAMELKSDSADAYYNRGIYHDYRQDYDSALRDFDAAIRLKPWYWKAFINKGIVHEKKGDYAASLADYSDAIKANPRSEVAYYYRGLVFYARGEYEKALADFNSSLMINPGYAEGYRGRAFVYGKTGKTGLAQSEIAKYNSLKDK